MAGLGVGVVRPELDDGAGRGVHDVHVQHRLGPPGARAAGVATARPDRHLVVVAVHVALEHETRQGAVDQRAQERVAQRALVRREARCPAGVGERSAERTCEVAREAGRQQRRGDQQQQRGESPEGRRLHRCLPAFHWTGS